MPTRPSPRPAPTARLTADTQVAKACKHVVRHLHSHGLRAGDRLPAQAEFREATEFSNDTLSAAMRILVQAGLLQRKTKVGTVVDHPDAVIRGLWTVGLAFPSDALCRVPFFSQLLGALQAQLAQAECRCRFYLGTAISRGPRYFSDFPFLEEDLAEGRLDAVIIPAEVEPASWDRFLAAGGIPVYVGSSDKLRCAVLIEQKTMVRQAVNLLARQGCRRLAVATYAYPHPGYDHYWIGLQDDLAKAGLPLLAEEPISSNSMNGAAGGRRIAADLLARPPQQRPDGVVVLDDWLAMGLAAALREAGGYTPKLVVQCNKQAPLAFALPATRFQVDVEELAAQSVALMLERLNAPARPERIRWLQPQLANTRREGTPP
ncbi:MAG: substrate-binding domain-containing protein [Lentisphaeria bacterium]